ncbi:hypothetical protein GI065_14105 [Salmonella enterica]|nr:hypothetical protein [Salmonella enterica]OIN36168.1 hypothetical protein AO411_2026785 [Salmonella enterica subsp. enterica serovar Sarajane]ECJ3538045.1 hypothetical protein [Salmonella enterica]EDN2676069.1 hypothetical protein [Salmonella enterica]EEN5461760.1 hypothetical protein [Salmonella enterica]
MKKHKGSKEQERYYARKNREMDRLEARDKSSVYAHKAAGELTKREGVKLGADISEEVINDSRPSAIRAMILNDALVSMEMPFGDLKKIIRRAWLKGLDKGREQGGLEPLFKGEEKL